MRIPPGHKGGSERDPPKPIEPSRLNLSNSVRRHIPIGSAILKGAHEVAMHEESRDSIGKHSKSPNGLSHDVGVVLHSYSDGHLFEGS